MFVSLPQYMYVFLQSTRIEAVLHYIFVVVFTLEFLMFSRFLGVRSEILSTAFEMSHRTTNTTLTRTEQHKKIQKFVDILSLFHKTSWHSMGRIKCSTSIWTISFTGFKERGSVCLQGSIQLHLFVAYSLVLQSESSQYTGLNFSFSVMLIICVLEKAAAQYQNK